MKESPWKTFSSLPVCKNNWFAVREDRVIGPDGEPGTYHVVSAGRLAVGVLPLWEDGSLTLVGQYRYPIKEYTWEIPEGGGEFDVDPLETAKRELREETGIRAETWEYLGRTHTSNCFLDEVCHLFLATGLTQGVAEPGPEEILQVKRVPFAEAIAMVKDGRITDAISIAGIFHLLAHQQCGSRTVAR
jgi:8-oxo-dGTP pyrophosphatase MutT (NUDIX family)